jgi:signal transduction histidine kinase
VLLAGVLLFLAPLGFVLGSALVENAFAGRTELRMAQCGDAVALAGAEPRALQAAVETHCKPFDLLVRSVTSDGLRVVSDELVGAGTIDRLGDVLYGDERIAYLAELDRTGSLDERPEVRSAALLGRSSACELVSEANLRVCALAIRTGPSAALVHVVGSSRTARVARYGARRELIGMAVFGALLATVLVIWLRRVVTGPVHDLARDVDALRGRGAPRGTSRTGPSSVASPGSLERLDAERPRELAEVARAFNRLQAALTRADAQNEAFLADLAHEMKNPVAAISAAAEALEVGDDPERRARLTKAIAASASRLDRLVRQFLELARAEAGLADDEREHVDLAELVRGIASTIDDPKLRLRIEEGVFPIEGVSGKLESSIRNLVDNALSFSRAEVELAVRGEPDHTVITVSDDGPGIALEDLPRVFTRFFSGRTDGRGTGLGLAIVRAIAEAHGGTVDVASAGDGTRFSLRLPRLR